MDLHFLTSRHTCLTVFCKFSLVGVMESMSAPFLMACTFSNVRKLYPSGALDPSSTGRPYNVAMDWDAC